MHRFCSGNGRLAQLVQSICLTSRGSAVRIRQRPLKKFPIPLADMHLGRLAQLVQSICLTSRGSAVRIRQRPLKKFPIPLADMHLGRLAQLVQSICLTSRGSAVRIRQRPQIKTAIEKRLPFLFYVEYYKAFSISCKTSDIRIKPRYYLIRSGSQTVFLGNFTVVFMLL